MKTEYSSKNTPITGMADDDFYGRQEALGVDMVVCRRAAVQEVKAGLSAIVHGHSRRGMLSIQIARVKLAIVLGNEAMAMDYLASTEIPAHWLGNMAYQGTFAADRDELARGVARQHPHPELAEKLTALDAERSALR